jgi:hypothetical protein
MANKHCGVVVRVGYWGILVVGWQIKRNATWRKLLICASIIAKCAAGEPIGGLELLARIVTITI